MRALRLTIWFTLAFLTLAVVVLGWLFGVTLLLKGGHDFWAFVEFFGGLAAGCWVSVWDGWPRVERWFIGRP